MTDAEKEVNALRGEPIVIGLCGREVKIQRLTIEKQIDVAETFEGATEQAGIRETATKMKKIVSIATDISEQELNEKSSLSEITTAFKAIWKQNDFDFLVETGKGSVEVKAV